MKWADPEGVAEAVRRWAAEQRRRHAGVSLILWYGSWVSGRPTPSSDVDLCVVVRDDARTRRDRIPDFLPDRFPTGVDLIVLTGREMEELAVRSPTWHAAITGGRVV